MRNTKVESTHFAENQVGGEEGSPLLCTCYSTPKRRD